MKTKKRTKSFIKHKIKCAFCGAKGTRSHAVWKRSKTKLFFCNEEHRLAFFSQKGQQGICGHKGCNKKAVHNNGRRYCEKHLNDYKAKKKITDTKWKTDNREKHLQSSKDLRAKRYERVWKILRVIRPNLLLKDVCEKVSRNIFIEELNKATLDVRNEANFRGMEHERIRLDIDLLIKWLKLIIEWKLTLNTVSKKALAEQLKTQIEHIKNEGITGYDHILVGVDGSTGTYNFLTIFIYIKDRVNQMYQNGFRPVNFRIDIFNKVMDENIAKLKTVEHLFLTPTNDYTFEMVWGSAPVLPPMLQEML